MKYNLSDIHWQQFETIAYRVLQNEIDVGILYIKWGNDQGRDIIHTGKSNNLHSDWIGEWIIQVKHKNSSRTSVVDARTALLSDLKQELKKVFITYNRCPDNYLLVTNLETDVKVVDGAMLIVEKFFLDNPHLKRPNFDVFGYQFFESRFDADVQLKWAFPFVIAQADFQIIIENIFARSRKARTKGWIEAIAQRRHLFVVTKSYDEAIRELHEHAVILSGPPRSGKTFNGEMITLLLSGQYAYEPLRIDKPDEVEEFYDENLKQVFFCDDAFGLHELSYSSAEEWDRKLESILNLEDENHKFIFTSRENVLRAFKKYAKRKDINLIRKIIVEVGNLTLDEKRSIYIRYVTESILDEEFKRKLIEVTDKVIDHKNFSPETVRSFFTNISQSSILEHGVVLVFNKHLDEPDEYLKSIFINLKPEKQVLLLSVLCAIQGKINDVGRKYSSLTTDLRMIGLTSYIETLEELDKGILHILKENDVMQVDYYHPSMREFIVRLLSRDSFGLFKQAVLKNINTAVLNIVLPKELEALRIIGIKKFPTSSLLLHREEVINLQVGLVRMVDNDDADLGDLTGTMRYLLSDPFQCTKMIRPYFLEIKELGAILLNSMSSMSFFLRHIKASLSEWGEFLITVKSFASQLDVSLEDINYPYLQKLLDEKKEEKNYWKIIIPISAINESIVNESIVNGFVEQIGTSMLKLGTEILGPAFVQIPPRQPIDKPNRTWYKRYLDTKAVVSYLKISPLSHRKYDSILRPMWEKIILWEDYAKNRDTFIRNKGWWR